MEGFLSTFMTTSLRLYKTFQTTQNTYKNFTSDLQQTGTTNLNRFLCCDISLIKRKLLGFNSKYFNWRLYIDYQIFFLIMLNI